MRSFLFVLLAGCAVSPVVVEEDSRSLIGGPELTQQEEAPLSATEVVNSIDGSVEGSLPTEEEEEAVSSSVFIPGRIDVYPKRSPNLFPFYTPSKLAYRGMISMVLLSLVTA